MEEGAEGEEGVLQFLQVPGNVADGTHASCARAVEELEIIANAFVFAPECT
jgi:hypothetical protein